VGNKIITYEHVKEEFDKRGYTLVSKEYINAKTHLEYICNKHKDKGILKIVWGSFNNGNGCRHCSNDKASNRITKSDKQFKEEVSLWGEGEYETLDPYVHNAKNIRFLHKTCGNVFLMAPNSFKQGQRCPKCSAKRVQDGQRKTQAQFEKDVFNLVGDEYKVLGKYKGTKRKIEFIHNKCGLKFEKVPVKFLTSGERCPKCSNRIMNRNTENIKEEIKELTNGEFSFIGEYKRMSLKALFKHHKCGTEWMVAPDTFINGGVRCPKCCESKAEKEINDLLILNKVTFKAQFRIKECKHVKTLPFDFAIFDNKKLKCLIEYDGEQHYKPWYKMGKEKAIAQLEKTKVNDKIKTDYCKNNNIKLLRIPYTKRGCLDHQLKLNSIY